MFLELYVLKRKELHVIYLNFPIINKSFGKQSNTKNFRKDEFYEFIYFSAPLNMYFSAGIDLTLITKETAVLSFCKTIYVCIILTLVIIF